jgi:hypothetical protein
LTGIQVGNDKIYPLLEKKENLEKLYFQLEENANGNDY